MLDREREYQEQYQELQRDYEKLEKTHIRMKAQEYDKVDVLKVNAELEGKICSLQSEVENLVKDRNALQIKL